MATMAQKPVPKVPSSKAIVAQAGEEISALKRQLNDITSWEISPNSWDKIQIIYVERGSEQQARSFLAAIELPTPLM